MADEDLNKNSTKQKSRKLFWGMLLPLLLIVILTCSFFYAVSNQILKAYMKNQIELSVEKLNSTVSESMQPIILNVSNFCTFAKDYDDDIILTQLLITFGSKLDQYASMLYYAPSENLKNHAKLLNNTDWIPPEDMDWTERVWFKEAVNNGGKTN